MRKLRVWKGTREEFRAFHHDKRLACDVVEFIDVAAYHSYIFILGIKMAVEITWCILIEDEHD